MLEIVMRRCDDHADDEVDQAEQDADEAAQIDPSLRLASRSPLVSSATCEPHDRHDDEDDHEDPDDTETSDGCKHVFSFQLLGRALARLIRLSDRGLGSEMREP
jgi:hypothetical protein